MTIRIQAGNADLLPSYAAVPIAFRVDSLFRMERVDSGLGGIVLREEKIASPFIKDYDAYEQPTAWPQRFNLRNWCVLLALDGEHPVAGATLAFDTPGVHMLAGRTDLTVLWDIRVHPDVRGKGVGTQLFTRAVEWARTRKCCQLKIETQNINVPACRFYARQGCHLGEINCYAYANEPSVADEVMLVWYLNL
ncbi:MAG: GNAT family N-acetyltransferase [Chloroflexi bacterium]|nr:GNAT family N-acetyltransferase [Chloroflexota bacterium]